MGLDTCLATFVLSVRIHLVPQLMNGIKGTGIGILATNNTRIETVYKGDWNPQHGARSRNYWGIRTLSIVRNTP
jgi:hypothetical protein